MPTNQQFLDESQKETAPGSIGAQGAAGVQKPSQAYLNQMPSQSSANPTLQQAAATTAPSGANLSPSEQGITQQLQQINPLAMQMFYNQIVAPMMKQIGGMTQQANKQYASTEQQIANEPFMKGNVAAQDQLAQVPQEQLGNTNLVNAYMGAAAAAPYNAGQAQNMSNLQSLISQDLAVGQKLSDPTYAALVQAAGGAGALSGGVITTSSPAYTAAQAAGASPQVLQAMLGSSATAPVAGSGTVTGLNPLANQLLAPPTTP